MQMVMFQEGNLGDLKLLKEEVEERPWYTKLSNKECVDLVMLMVKSPGDFCIIPKALRGEAGWQGTRGSLCREGVLSDQHLLGA